MESSSQAELPVTLAAVARPGDTLVVGISISVTDDEYTVLVERFKPLMDAGIQVFLVENTASLVVVRGGSDAKDGE